MAIGGKDFHSALQFPTHNAPRVWLITSGDSPAGIALARQVLNHGDHVVSGVSSTAEEAGAQSEEFKSFLADMRTQIGFGWKDRLKVVTLDIRCASL